MEAGHRFTVWATDPDWFGYLRSRPEITELNFWRPSGQTTEYPLGTPWFLQVRRTNAISGVAFFVSAIRLPIGSAWEIYGTGNGFDTFDDFAAKIADIRGVDVRDLDEIGCELLSDPIYFDSPVNARQRLYGPFSSYSTLDQEGALLFAELRAAMASRPLQPALSMSSQPYGAPTLFVPRLGQASFRSLVTNAYDKRCAVTNERTLPVLQAAHIVPYSRSQSHDVRNGILLRSDLHTLFDQGYVSVRPDFAFVVSAAIRQEFENGRDYYALNGRRIRVPENPDLQPEIERLDWHYSEVFKR